MNRPIAAICAALALLSLGACESLQEDLMVEQVREDCKEEHDQVRREACVDNAEDQVRSQRRQ